MIIARTTKLVPPAKSESKLSHASLDRLCDRNTSKLVELETECYGEEEELVANCDKQSNGEIIIIESMDFGHD